MANEKELSTHRAWLQQLSDYQQSDLDQREQARESDHFLLDKDGQWELKVAKSLDSQQRPRYTFDKVTPVIESIMSDIEDMEFSVNVKPQGGEANKDDALMREGMIRTIESNSKATAMYRKAARRVVRRGFDAWEVKSKYLDPWSFEQDIVIQSIPNAINRVWFDNTSTEQDGSDIENAYVLTSMSPADYKATWPKGAAVSVNDSEVHEQYENGYQPEVITVGKKYFRKPVKVEVVQMSNGDVLEVNDNNKKVFDELAQAGVTISNRKKVDDFAVYCQYFDGAGMLEEATKTPFKSIPVIPVYGNHEILGHSSKVTYSGITLKEMDAQRVHNYAKSREIEEGALAPRTKWWMTKKQAKGNEKQLQGMNTSADPVQFYTHDPDVVPPYQGGSNQINPHLATLGNQMAEDINKQASVFSAMQGDIGGRLSEDSVRMQIDRGTGTTRKWVNSIAVAIGRTGDIILEAMPVVYDTKRQMQITGIDGTEEMVLLNDEVFDNQTGKMIQINNLNKGKYKVVCDAGPAFANKMEAGLDALLKYAAIDPSVLAQGGDVMLRSINAPLVDQIAKRKRAVMLQQGLIPMEQMTDQEKEQAAMQAQQPKQLDPAMMLEMKKADAEVLREQNRAQQLQIDIAKLQQSGAELQLKAQGQQMDNMTKAAGIDNTQADTAKKWAEVEKTVGESTSTQIDNIQKVTPQVTVVAQVER